MTMHPFTGTTTHGKFKSLCEDGTEYRGLPTGLNYIKSLGVTHVQFMPLTDFSTVDDFKPELNYNWGV